VPNSNPRNPNIKLQGHYLTNGGVFWLLIKYALNPLGKKYVGLKCPDAFLCLTIRTKTGKEDKMSGINAFLGLEFVLGMAGFLALLVWWLITMLRNRPE